MERVIYLAVFGSDIFEQYPQLHDIALTRNEMNPKQNEALKLLLHFGQAAIYASSKVKEAAEIVTKMKTRLSDENLVKYKTSNDILNVIKQEIQTIEDVTCCHLLATNNSILYQIITFSILMHGAKKMTTEHQRDITLILGK